MASHRQIAANRRNAQRSTGPRTPAGVKRAARNAMRHGLTIPLARDPAASAEIDRLAAALVGRCPTPARLEQARIAAEAELELRRVRRHRKSLLDRNAVALAAHQQDDDRHHDRRWQPVGSDGQREGLAIAAALPELEALERYERRARSRRTRAMRWLMYTSILIEG